MNYIQFYNNQISNRMELIEDKFQLIKMGSNSKIFRYGDKNSAVVLKAVSTQCKKQSTHMLNQYKILKKINHQNIINVLKYKQNVKLNGMGQNSQLGLFNILVFEEARFGNLLDFYKRNRLTIPQIKFLFLSVCKAVGFLHSNFIAHRDLKLQNILLFQSQGQIIVKLADFGFSQSVSDGQQIKMFNTFKGTKRGFMAPEIHECLKKPQLSYEARKSDIFALGVIIFCLMFGKLPFEYANKQNKLYNLISQKKYDQFWSYHSKQLQSIDIQDFSMVEQFKNLFLNMVNYNAQQRYTISNILQHCWIKNGIENSLSSQKYK